MDRRPDDDYWIGPGGVRWRVDMQPGGERLAPWVRWVIGTLMGLIPIAAGAAGTNLKWSMQISDRLTRLEERVANTSNERMRALEIRLDQAVAEKERLERRIERLERGNGYRPWPRENGNP